MLQGFPDTDTDTVGGQYRLEFPGIKHIKTPLVICLNDGRVWGIEF